MPKEIAVKLAIGVFTCLALMSTIYIGELPYGGGPRVGDVAARTVYAPFDFSYFSGVDLERTEELKKAAALGVEAVCDIDSDVFQGVAQNIKSLLAKSKELRGADDIGIDGKVARLKAADKFDIAEWTLKSLLQSPELENAQAALLDELNASFAQGIISEEDKKSLTQRGDLVVSVRDAKAGTEIETDLKNIKTAEELKVRLADVFGESYPADKKLKDALLEIATKSLRVNLKLNEPETQSRREKAIVDVPVQKKLIDVKRDELIVLKGERLTPTHVAKLEALYTTSFVGQRIALLLLGVGLVVLALVTIISFYYAFYEPKIFSNNRHLFLISVILLILVASGKIIAISKVSNYLIPVASGPMIIAMLLGARPAVVIAVVLSFLTGLLAGEKFDLTLIFFVSSIAGIYAVKDARRRSHLFKAGVIAGLAGSFCVVSLEILSNLDFQNILNDSWLVLLNGIIVGIVLTGTLHIFESLFQMITNVTLLELADPNNPLLKDLILKAPGTYHHSLVVGNLAESASEAIGANGLLARVGAYYHDIGKVEKAEYFVENQPIIDSQHDKLAPTMSSLIIINHVKEGLEKAKKARLNRTLIDFIEQHHGTGLIYYFYQRALESVEDLEKVGEEGFRYPGPKPQTKETAIVHLADSVEAASRTLKNPSPANLEELVRRIINNKFIDGQLDECELTLKDLNVIAAIFTKVLTSVYHMRIDYPNEKAKGG